MTEIVENCAFPLLIGNATLQKGDATIRVRSHLQLVSGKHRHTLPLIQTESGHIAVKLSVCHELVQEQIQKNREQDLERATLAFVTQQQYHKNYRFR